MAGPDEGIRQCVCGADWDDHVDMDVIDPSNGEVTVVEHACPGQSETVERIMVFEARPRHYDDRY